MDIPIRRDDDTLQFDDPDLPRRLTCDSCDLRVCTSDIYTAIKLAMAHVVAHAVSPAFEIDHLYPREVMKRRRAQ